MDANTRTSTRKQPRQARAQATVGAILKATAQLLVSGGYDQLTTNRVAAKAGVSVGSLYQYFPGKEALVAALVDEHHAEMLALLNGTMAGLGQNDVEGATRVFVTAMFRAHALEPELHRVLVMEVPRITGLNKVRDLMDEARPLVRMFLELHRARLRVQDLDAAAFLLVYAVQGATQAAVLHGRLVTSNADAMAAEVSDMVLRYLLAQPRDAP